MLGTVIGGFIGGSSFLLPSSNWCSYRFFWENGVSTSGDRDGYRKPSTPSNCILWFQWFVKRSVARQACAGVATLRQSSLTQTDGRFTSHPLGFRKDCHFFVTATGNTPVLLHRCVSNWQPFQKAEANKCNWTEY